MRRLALGLVLLGLLAVLGYVLLPRARADTPAPAPADSDEKKGAELLYGQLKQCETNHNNGVATSDADWAALDAKVAAYQTEFGVTPKTTHNLIWLRRTEIDVARKVGDMPRYHALLQTLAADPHAEVVAFAKDWIGLTMQPLDLQFTAVDGRPVDLASLRGKVVLIDFWATWCGPCREEVPNVVAAYQKYHDKGFEVIGVSLDQNKDALLAFTKTNGMVWPQYFDGKMWQNDVSQRFHINLIPGMWLVGKDGVVITTRAREDLEGDIEKALAVP